MCLRVFFYFLSMSWELLTEALLTKLIILLLHRCCSALICSVISSYLNQVYPFEPHCGFIWGQLRLFHVWIRNRKDREHDREHCQNTVICVCVQTPSRGRTDHAESSGQLWTPRTPADQALDPHRSPLRWQCPGRLAHSAEEPAGLGRMGGECSPNNYLFEWWGSVHVQGDYTSVMSSNCGKCDAADSAEMYKVYFVNICPMKA